MNVFHSNIRSYLRPYLYNNTIILYKRTGSDIDRIAFPNCFASLLVCVVNGYCLMMDHFIFFFALYVLRGPRAVLHIIYE